MGDSIEGKTAMGGFGFTKKSAKKKDVGAMGETKDEGPRREYLTGVAGSELEMKDKIEEVSRAIPVQKDTFEVGHGRQRKAPSFLPDSSAVHEDNERFEVAEASLGANGATAQHGDVVYGLTKMGPKPGAERKESKPAQESFIGRSLQEKELQAFKEDLEDLPEEATLDDYDSMPIEDFGAAMLRGMGWEEGQPVGRNSKGLVAAVEFVPRSGRLGLGANPAPKEEIKKKYIKPGESRERPADMVLAEGPEGKSRNVKSIDEKLVKREAPGAREGKKMCVVEGRHRGLIGRVLKVVQQEGRSDRAQLELSASGEVVTIRVSELADLGSREADEAQGKNLHRRDDGGAGKKRERDGGDEMKQKKEQRTEKEEPAWLYPGIRVRIVSKSFLGGRHYLKKAVVADVLSPRECVLELEGGEALSNVPQRALETALPKRGGRIAILQGPFRGQRGKMLDKSGEAASVQLNEDFSIHNFSLDAIAEYTGVADEND
mmetsp:Transcript_14895/g.36013  ORF Transcript_14895/g.36013 Transcript_14895/m.36013 type:complete len:489 (-) Transcript_14895:1573-3039(-)|eukprot:CAMPEP_0197606280 /NCGR_PEP_ID=MMETSP1326-20131121/44713_1 /TAXON_ID=1155430 /ORGANISM="Genus nov. species nov., Strain RCC2288" /LENGTH=488 /DNA_ID=CAMNT_0043174171 /DNA_START=151 /DNA_END=1617 /DNA_ORIENTATION=+